MTRGLEARGRSRRLLACPEGHQRDPPGAANRQPRQHERHALGHVGLEPVRGAEGHRGRHVEHDPRGERPLGHVETHVWLAGAGSRRRVEVANVIAGLVGAQLGKLHPRADAGRAAVARQSAGGVGGRRPDRALRPASAGIGPGPCRAAGVASDCIGSRRRPQAEVVAGGLRHRDDHPFHDLVGADALRERVVGEHEPVAQHIDGEVSHVVAVERGRAPAAVPVRAPTGSARSAPAGSRRTRSAARAPPARIAPGAGWLRPGRLRSRSPRGPRAPSARRARVAFEVLQREAFADRGGVAERASRRPPPLRPGSGSPPSPSSGSGRPGPRGAGRCPRPRSGSESPSRGTGAGTGKVCPPIVTCCSCMTSSSADWTLAGARLISSASRKLPNTGPSSTSNVPVSGR